MSQYTLLRGARQLITLNGPKGARSGCALQTLNVVQDGSVLIKDGFIAQVGSTRRLENLKESREAIELDVHGSVVMPGFIDPGLRVTPLAWDGGHASEEKPKRLGRLFDDTLALLRSCLLHGTLVAEVKGGTAAEDFRSDIAVLRRLAKLGNNPVATIRTWQLAQLPHTEDDVRDFCGILERVSRTGLIHFVETAAGDGGVSEALRRGLASANVGLKIRWTGGGEERLRAVLDKLRPVSLFCSAELTKAEAEVLAEFGGTVVFAPASALGSDSAGLRLALDAGARVALSTGYDAQLSPGYSMQMAVSLACVNCKVSIEEALTAATINAAHTMGCSDLLGTLEAGKRADLLVLDIPDYREIPRQFGINNVGMVLREGAVVMNRSRWKIGTHEPSPGRVRSQHFRRPSQRAS